MASFLRIMVCLLLLVAILWEVSSAPRKEVRVRVNKKGEMSARDKNKFKNLTLKKLRKNLKPKERKALRKLLKSGLDRPSTILPEVQEGRLVAPVNDDCTETTVCIEYAGDLYCFTAC